MSVAAADDCLFFSDTPAARHPNGIMHVGGFTKIAYHIASPTQSHRPTTLVALPPIDFYGIVRQMIVYRFRDQGHI